MNLMTCIFSAGRLASPRIATLVMFFFVAGMCPTVSAQAVDTLRGPVEHYLYPWWDDSAGICQHDGLSCYRFYLPQYIYWYSDETYGMGGNGGMWPSVEEVAMGFHVDDSVKVLGMAVVTDTSSSVLFMIEDTSDDAWKEYLTLYKPLGNSMGVMGRQPVHATDACRRLSVDGVPLWHASGPLSQCYRENWIYDLHEVFFDSAIWVADSFYIGLTRHGSAIDPANPNWMPSRPLYAVYQTEIHDQDNIPLRYPLIPYRFRMLGSESWMYGEFRSLMMVYPIIELEGDTCPQVQNFTVVPQGGGSVLVYWSPETNHSWWEIAYGIAGTPIDSCSHVTVYESPIQLTGLMADSSYEVHIRAVCRLGNYMQGLWSSSLPFRPVPGAGFDEGSLREPNVTIYPNPAKDMLTIKSDILPASASFFDMQGRERDRVELTTPATGVSIGSLERGVYVVRVVSDGGSTIGRLVVD